MPTDPSLKVAVSFHSRNCVQKVQLNTREKNGWTWPKMCAFISYLFQFGVIVFEADREKTILRGKILKLFWECNLKILVWICLLLEDVFSNLNFYKYESDARMNQDDGDAINTGETAWMEVKWIMSASLEMRKKDGQVQPDRNHLSPSPLHVPLGVGSHKSCEEN